MKKQQLNLQKGVGNDQNIIAAYMSLIYRRLKKEIDHIYKRGALRGPEDKTKGRC